MADQEGSHPLDQLFSVLRHPLRRRILFRLSERTPCTDGDLPVGVFGTGADEPDVLTIQLRHVHFPKLEDAGYIEWDKSADSVRRGPKFDDIEPVVGLLRDQREAFPADWAAKGLPGRETEP